MPFAAIDIGTNSVLLLIMDKAESGELKILAQSATVTRLGQGVDATGELHPDAIKRTLTCLSELAAVCDKHGAHARQVVATSAARDAKGAAEFSKQAESIIGVPLQIIAGEREAELTFRGASAGLGPLREALVFDVGGGSTEVVLGDSQSGIIQWATSLDIGAVRLSERLGLKGVVSKAQCEEVAQAVAEALAVLPAPPQNTPLVGIAGTVTTLAALEKKLATYDGDVIHGSRLSKAVVDKWVARLAGFTLEQRRALPGLHPKRADVIVAGAVIVQSVMHWAQREELVVSDRGVRFGLAYEWAAGALAALSGSA